MIYVTHDQIEAMTLADSIVVLSAGKTEQVGTPLELYSKLANLFVAQFIGSPAMNIFNADLVTTGETTRIRTKNRNEFYISISSSTNINGQTLSVGVRPEDFCLADKASCMLSGEIVFIELLGEVTLLHLNSNESSESLVVKLPGIINKEKGEIVFLRLICKKHIYLIKKVYH